MIFAGISIGDEDVKDTAFLLNKLGSLRSFSRADLYAIMMESGYQTSDSIVNHLIGRMVHDGAVIRLGRNRYTVANDKKIYHFPHSEKVISLADEIRSAHPYLDFRIFELVQLNEFVNHQIAQNMIFVSVEGELEEDVFNTLWENHEGSVLLKPSIEDLFRYMTEGIIVINKLPSESPKGITDFWDTRLEKMLVDIAVDKLLGKVVYSGEYPAIFQDAFVKYAIDKNVMARYARRRGALDKYRAFLRNEAGILQEEFSL